MPTEAEYLRTLAEIFASNASALRVGIGDDAAVVDVTKNSLALSTDMAVEGVHFRREWSSNFEIGAKVTAANLADIYAMGGKPQYLMVAAAIPADFSIEQLSELARGIADEAAKVGAIVVGGDLTRSPLLTIAISVFGEVVNPILRGGAKVGDIVAISALPGASSRGFEVLMQGKNDGATLLHRHPHVEYSKIEELDRTLVHSLTDVSDGLISELQGIASDSHVGIELNSQNLPTDMHTLHGGEDHVFVGTFTKVPAGWIEVGKVVEGSGVKLDGVELTHEGFKHF